MKQQTARQHWLSVLAHSEASALASHWQALQPGSPPSSASARRRSV